MIIDKNSWHYKFIDNYSFGWIGFRNNICKYIRGFAGACLNICLGILVISCLVYLASMPIVHWRMGALGGPAAILVILGYMVDIIIFLFLCGILYENRNKAYQSPFGQYIKDKHNKVCTMIEYK